MFNAQGQRKQAALEELITSLRESATDWILSADRTQGVLTREDEVRFLHRLATILTRWGTFADEFALIEANLPPEHPCHQR